ncbi:sigma-54 interaction domain-containing protein [Tunturiibacter psychrotolerans]|jgi:two-component system, NtrC family, response regulator AtoC|uniref:sigma-54 interaction domain-containing protein n=1 Tax=Tunturiibacter psychrotolerans TaxID=3069686 RepID=UPI003D1C31B1
MIGAVKILVISDDAEVCNLIHSAFEFEGNSAVCVSCPLEALQLLHRGLVANFLLIHATRNRSNENLFAVALLQNFSREKLCILAEAGDTSWRHHAAKWKIDTVLTMPLLRQDIEKLRTQPSFDTIAQSLETAGPASPAANTSINVPHYHMEELDNDRFFLAASPIMMQLYRDVRLLAPVNVPVLILGESGVGKEIVAMLLHKYYPNPEGKFLNINCAALPTELLESELFGYEAGAFTGALRSKPGLFELANKGTLLLDEIGEMSPHMQAKLLHVLQDGSFCRLGARSPSRADVRVLAATNINMQDAIAEKRFREDLYYRLNILTITVPPLRERREEIPLLMEQMFLRGALEFGKPIILSRRLVEAAQEYHWPGNLRELRNFVTRTLILRDEESAYNDLRAKTRTKVLSSREDTNTEAAINKSPIAASMKNAVNEVKNETEIRILQDALSASGWNRRKAAVNLNISYRTLLYKIQQHRLSA